MKLITAKHKLKSILKDNTYSRTIVSRKGKIRGSRLHSYKTSDKIFSKKLEDSGKKYNLEILFDASGSMAHHHGEGVNSAFYKGILLLKDLVKLFDGVININIIFFNLKENLYTTKQVLNIDMYSIDSLYTQFKFMGENDINKLIDINSNRISLIEVYDGTGDYQGAQGNWEICNIRNSFERLSKKDGEKLMIVIGDGNMRIDGFSEYKLIRDNYYICGQSCKKYNPKTAEEVCKHIVKNGVKMFGLSIGKNPLLDYIQDRKHIDAKHLGDIFEILIGFIKKSFK